jgi:hypothetical protein
LIFDFAIPLTGDYSINLSYRHDYIDEPADSSILNPDYMDDPFFENENLLQSDRIKIAVHRLFTDLKFSISFQGFKKNFFPLYARTRNDNGFTININLTKSV